MTRRKDDIGDWIEAEAGGAGLSVFGWGFGSVVAFVLAFASWQYAPPRSPPAATVRADIGQPDPSEITGSIASSENGQTAIQPSRSYGVGRLAPLPLAVDETPATSRDIERLQAEIAEIRRRIVQIGMAGDGMARRVDGIEERVTGMSGGSEPAATAAVVDKPSDPAPPLDKPRSEARAGERLPTPLPRPAVVPPPAAPSPAFDPDGPATTGAVPKTTRPHDPVEGGEAKPAKVEGASEDKPAKASRLPVAAAAPPAVPATPPPSTASVSVASVAAPPPSAAPAPAAEEKSPPATVRVVTAPAQPATAASPGATTTPAAAIDLGGYRSLASLRRAWSDTTVRHADLAKGYEPLARLRETDTGMEARLLAGPFADQTEAAKACLRLKALGAPCAVTTYTGQPVGGLR